MPTSPQDQRRRLFASAVERNMDALYAVALRMTRNPHDAQDLVAEAVIRAWSAFDTLAEQARFRGWLFRIMRNEFVSGLRRRRARPPESSYQELCTNGGEEDLVSLLAEETDAFLDWWANPEQRVANDHLARDIVAAIDLLPEAFRTTILLVNVDGLTYDEAAAALGVPAGTVRSRMKRGRTMLQKALWQQARDAGLPVAASGSGDGSD